MGNEDDSVQVVFNGEIYNYRELRAELAAQGHRFTTNSDTETIVHGFEQHGSNVFARLQGMFAVAVWDVGNGVLTLARDRFGKKPLVCARTRDRLYFASEAKAILALPGVPRLLDPAALHAYLLLQYVPAPRSIFRDFWKVMPGTSVSIRASGAGDAAPPIEHRRFWRLSAGRRFTGSYADAKAELGRVLTHAVEKRLISDVPLGAFLSGGIDSSVVVGLMRRLGVSPLRTFSIGFAEAAYDESAFAEQVAKQFGTEHHALRVTPDARGVLDTLAYHYDEPFADSSAIPTWYVSRMTREQVTVALTGDGGDECFAGYDRYRAAQLAGRFERVPAFVRRAVAAAADWLPHGKARTRSNRAYRFLKALAETPSRRYLSWINVFTPAQLVAGYRDEFAAQLADAQVSASTPAGNSPDIAPPAIRATEDALAWFDRLYEAAPGSLPERANTLDFETYLPGDLLTKVDIASMACSLECRAPFLDHELAEFAASLPLEWKLGSRDGKLILRDWASGLLPSQVLNRPKMGFGVPVGRWFRGELRDLLREKLLADDSMSRVVFREDWLRRLIEEHVAAQSNHEHALWALLMLELWRERWMPGVP